MLEKKTQGKDKYRAVIIGAGNIGSGFDSPKSKEILTHAHAYSKHSRTVLSGFFDVNNKKAKKAGKKWNSLAFSNIEDMFKVAPDIVSICTPSEIHFQTLLKVLKYKPKLVICEKPITLKINDTQKIIKEYKQANVPIIVNYFRRYDKKMQELKKEIIEKKYGEVICASGIYSKGIFNNGSHLINLCHYLFGDIKALSRNYEINDYKKDKSIAGFLIFEKCKQFHLMVGDNRKLSIFEIDIIFEKSRVRIFNFGFNISYQKIEKNKFYKNYYNLGKPKNFKTNLDKAYLSLIDNAINNIKNKQPINSDIYSAFKTQKICVSISKL